MACDCDRSARARGPPARRLRARPADPRRRGRAARRGHGRPARRVVPGRRMGARGRARHPRARARGSSGAALDRRATAGNGRRGARSSSTGRRPAAAGPATAAARARPRPTRSGWARPKGSSTAASPRRRSASASTSSRSHRRGAAAVACLTPRALRAGAEPAGCGQVAATLRLRGLHALPLRGRMEYTHALAAALARLDGERLAAHRQLAGAATRPEQRRAAAGLAAAYGARRAMSSGSARLRSPVPRISRSTVRSGRRSGAALPCRPPRAAATRARTRPRRSGSSRRRRTSRLRSAACSASACRSLTSSALGLPGRSPPPAPNEPSWPRRTS